MSDPIREPILEKPDPLRDTIIEQPKPVESDPQEETVKLPDTTQESELTDILSLYQLPNQHPVTLEEFVIIIERLQGVYAEADKIYQAQRRIKKTLSKDTKREDRESKALELLKEDPYNATFVISENIELFGFAERETIYKELLRVAPQQAASGLAENIYCFQYARRVPILGELLEKAPKQVVATIAEIIHFFPPDDRKSIFDRLIEIDPNRAIPILAKKLWVFKDKTEQEIARQRLLELATPETAPALADSLSYSMESDFAKLLQIAPEKVASILAKKTIFFPETERFARALKLIEIAPQQVARIFAEDIKFYPEQEQLGLAIKLLDSAPYQAALGLLSNMASFPQDLRDRIAITAWEAERAELEDAETVMNPALYDGLKNSRFYRRRLQKTGSDTILLGEDNLFNRIILRIVPVSAFVNWMNAYAAYRIWQEAGFNYVPIEPIVRASIIKGNSNNVRVFTGVLGVTVERYLKMFSVSDQDKYYVTDQVEKIQETLLRMGVNHGHPHSNNFCVVHERTSDGEIDWSKPPRVYCIDFDQSDSFL